MDATISNTSHTASAFQMLMSQQDTHERTVAYIASTVDTALRGECQLGKQILEMEMEMKCLLVSHLGTIDDAPGIVGNHSNPVHKSLLHLDFLFEDMEKTPRLTPAVLGAFIDSQYGSLRATLVEALKPNGVLNLDAVELYEKRGYITSPNVKTGDVMIRVRESWITV
jgi:hypothetical protein